MNIKCPHCGTEYEVEKKDMFRYTKCEVCGKGFVVGSEKSMLSSKNDSATTETSARAPKGGRFSPRHPQGSTQHADKVTLPGRFARPGRGEPPSLAQSATAKPKSSPKRKMIAVIGGISGLLLVAGLVAMGGYMYFGDEPRLGRGIAYYEKGLFPRAYKLLLPLAKKGYAKAQLLVGDCYANGQGVFMDTEEAVKWYRSAADQELPEALHRMFECCRDGVGVERNKANAAKWCRKSADAGLGEAMFDMGMLYVTGFGVEQNAKSAFKWFRKGAERGHPMGLYKFGQCYKLGFGVEKDEDEASKWQNKAVVAWRKMANEGNAQAMIRLAELYMEGDVVELDKEEAVKWYRKGAELGDEMAQYELATCYHEGKGVEEDQEESAKWMLKAADNGSNRSVQWAMGRYYQEGWGVEKNSAEAVKWFERSAKKGLALAKYYLAMCYMNGDGVQKDEAKGEQLLEEAADMGDEDAKKELSRIKRERREEEARIAREKEEKERKIERLSEIEDEIAERKRRINNILKGKQGGDWLGFDASKVTLTDASVSVVEEPELKSVADSLTHNDSLAKVNNAIQAAQTASGRLEERLKELARVKGIYDAKELESRKETCVPCKGAGKVECARCNGKGEVLVKENEPCPICSDDDNDGFTSTRRRGVVNVEVDCSNCRGRGEIWIRPRCQFCGGKGYTIIRETGRFDRKQRCDSCGGSGKSEGYSQSCPKCHGNGKVEIQRQCSRCGGKGTVATGSKVTCLVCGGKCKLTCERCGGKGFTYRPKQ